MRADVDGSIDGDPLFAWLFNSNGVDFLLALRGVAVFVTFLGEDDERVLPNSNRAPNRRVRPAIYYCAR